MGEAEGFISPSGIVPWGDREMPTIDDLRKGRIDKECPECAKQQRHVKLVRSKGRDLECPECHYMHPHIAR